MWFEDKKYMIDENWEKIEVKKISSTERKKWVKTFSKKIAPALMATMLASSASADNIDISKLPHYASLDGWLKKHVKVTYNKWGSTDWSDNYNTSYYERYNSKVKNIENTSLAWVENLNVVWGKMYVDWRWYNLVSSENVIPDSDTIKSNELDEVVISVNWTRFKAKPKFLKLHFVSRWKKWVFWYQMDKDVTLVYVSFLDKIKVLWYIDNYAWYIDTTPKDYEVNSNIATKRKIYENISRLLWCGWNCRYKKSRSWDIYFYSWNRFVGQIQDMWDKKFILKWNRVVAKLIERWNKVLLIDNNDNILYRSDGTKNVKISIPEVNMKMWLKLR